MIETRQAVLYTIEQMLKAMQGPRPFRSMVRLSMHLMALVWWGAVAEMHDPTIEMRMH